MDRTIIRGSRWQTSQSTASLSTSTSSRIRRYFGQSGKTSVSPAPNTVEALHKVQQAWINNDVPQCGYCQSGMIMAVAALLKDNPKPTDQDIDDAITNICRCGTFKQVREAIHAAANV